MLKYASVVVNELKSVLMDQFETNRLLAKTDFRGVRPLRINE
jgi:hypothetical protein